MYKILVVEDNPANMSLTARIVCDEYPESATQFRSKIVSVATISESEDLAATNVSHAIATSATVGLDQLDSGADRAVLNGIDLQMTVEPGSNE